MAPCPQPPVHTLFPWPPIHTLFSWPPDHTLISWPPVHSPLSTPCSHGPLFTPCSHGPLLLQNRVEISDLDLEVLQEMLTYIYTGKAPNLKKIADSLLSAADKVLVQEPCGMCGPLFVFASIGTQWSLSLLSFTHMHTTVGKVSFLSLFCPLLFIIPHIPHPPSCPLTLPHVPSPSLMSPHPPSCPLTLPHVPSPSLMSPHPPSCPLTLPHVPSPSSSSHSMLWIASR